MYRINLFLQSFFVLLLSATLFSCSSDDEPQMRTFPNLTLQAGSSSNILNGAGQNWVSSNEYIAAVSGSIVTAKRVGTAKISSSAGAFRVTVLGKYDLYDEPCIEWGASKSSVKSRMSAYTLLDETTTAIGYKGKKKEALTLYVFNESGLFAVGVYVPTSYAEELVNYLSERYIIAQRGDDYASWLSVDKKTVVYVTVEKLNKTYYYRALYASFDASSASLQFMPAWLKAKALATKPLMQSDAFGAALAN